MDLQTFVSETLVALAKGVNTAQQSDELGKTIIVPMAGRDSIRVQQVEFDVAITANDGSTAGAKIGVLGGLIGAGAEAGKQNNLTTATRIKFNVPICLGPKS